MKRDEAENHSYVIRKIPPKNKSTAAIQGIFCSDEGKTQKRDSWEERKKLLYPRKIALLKAFQYSYFSQ